MAKADKEMVKLRFRRTVTLADGTTYAANALATVEATDEAWALVNRGEADMEPGPGVAGQPFPPQELTTAPAPPTPLELQQRQQQQAAAPLAGAPVAAAPKGKAAPPPPEPSIEHAPPGTHAGHGTTHPPERGKGK